MAIFETYSQSKKNNNAVFRYDTIPLELKIQLIHLWKEYFSQQEIPLHIKDDLINDIIKIIKKEHSLLELPHALYRISPLESLLQYFQTLNETDLVLDIVQIVCICIEGLENYFNEKYYHLDLKLKGGEVLEEINDRFKMKGIGYQYINGKIIRIDNELLFDETIEKTLTLLNNPFYSNVNTEFLTAHEHFRFKRNADCLNWCLKSYESILKIIAKKNNWQHKKNSNSKELTSLLFSNNFFSPFMNAPIFKLKELLENSINTIRNKKGGHGSGADENIVPGSLTKYMLYLTGSTLLLILEAQIEYEKNNKMF